MTESKKDRERLDEVSSIESNNPSPKPHETITRSLGELDAIAFIEEMLPLVPQERRRGHCIILYLPAILEPIKLWNQTHITLGRNDKHLNLYPTVDFSEHHATLLGVSRIHAEITYEDSSYYVKDLNSKNGTWVNKIRLIQAQKIRLTNHDTLRLGHLMIQVSSYQDS